MPRTISPETALRRLKVELRHAHTDRYSSDRIVSSLRIENTRLRAEIAEWKDRCDRMINAFGASKESKG